MVNRFARASREVIVDARAEARAAGSPTLEAEHVLLALSGREGNVARRDPGVRGARPRPHPGSDPTGVRGKPARCRGHGRRLRPSPGQHRPRPHAAVERIVEARYPPRPANLRHPARQSPGTDAPTARGAGRQGGNGAARSCARGGRPGRACPAGGAGAVLTRTAASWIDPYARTQPRPGEQRSVQPRHRERLPGARRRLPPVHADRGVRADRRDRRGGALPATGPTRSSAVYAARTQSTKS